MTKRKLRRWLDWAGKAFFAFQLLRLRAERRYWAVRDKHRPRVFAVACWGFPIYSQTFVYQELAHLIRAGFVTRLAFAGMNQDPLASQFDSVWRARRRLIFTEQVCRKSLSYFRRRMPERVESLVATLAAASGASREEIVGHRHFSQAFAFARMVEAFGAQYIHSYFFYEGTLFAYVAAHLLGVPRGVSCYADHMLSDYRLKTVALHLSDARIVVATSERIRSELLAIAPDISAEKILVKPNGISVAQFPMIDRRSPAGELTDLVSVSRIVPKKGLLTLVEAAAILRDQGTPVRIHLIGATDRDEASEEYGRVLASRIDELNLTDSVRMAGTGSEAEINDYFRRAQIFVAPYVETEEGDKDGIPTALLEAMSSGLAVIATDAGSIEEVIDNGHDGLLVPQHDSVALASAIAWLAADPEARRLLGENGARKVRSRFDASIGEVAFHERVAALTQAASAGRLVGFAEGHRPDLDRDRLKT